MICPEPTCQLPAVHTYSRDLGDYLHEQTGTCKQGHIWTTKWFAERRESDLVQGG